MALKTAASDRRPVKVDGRPEYDIDPLAPSIAAHQLAHPADNIGIPGRANAEPDGVQ